MMKWNMNLSYKMMYQVKMLRQTENKLIEKRTCEIKGYPSFYLSMIKKLVALEILSYHNHSKLILINIFNLNYTRCQPLLSFKL